MADAAPQSPSDKLRKMRNDFADSAKKTLADFDERIGEAEKLERDQRRDADLQDFMPGTDKAVLKGHDIAFLINKTKDMGDGSKSPLGVSFAAAYKVHATVAGLDGVTVSAAFWGGHIGKSILGANLGRGANAYDGTNAEAKDFLSTVKELLTDSPAEPAKEQKHYIIISDGNFTGSADQAAAILETTARLNPKATFDFVVCNGGDTSTDAMLAKWTAADTAKPNLVKVGAPADITAAVMNIIKARLSGSQYNAPLPVVKAPAPPKAEPPPSASPTP